VKLASILVILFGTLQALGLPLHRYVNPGLPYSSEYGIFSDNSSQNVFFYLPLRMEIASDEAGNQRFGVQFSSSPTSSSEIATASLTITLMLRRRPGYVAAGSTDFLQTISPAWHWPKRGGTAIRPDNCRQHYSNLGRSKLFRFQKKPV